MIADCLNPKIEAKRYSGILPERIDILLLSVGEDGHIASLFPRSKALFEKTKKVVPVVGVKPPKKRLTISPVVIKNAQKVFVLAIGEVKAEKYRHAQRGSIGLIDCPACLVLGAQWFFDTVGEV